MGWGKTFSSEKKNHNDICRPIILKNTFCLGTSAIFSATVQTVLKRQAN